MLSQEKINRINALSRKSKSTGLTEREREEQQALRSEYLENFRKGFREQLEHIEVVDKEPE